MTIRDHVVMFSGGVGSWAAAKRVAARHGTESMTLLFTDTRMEDADLYRFLTEAAADVGVPVTRLADGRDPWQVFADVKFLGNTRVDPCSRILKRELAAQWLAAHCDPTTTRVYVGIDWTEEHRFTGLRARRAAQGWTYEAPLCDRPYLSKGLMFDQLAEAGIRKPRLYDLGFTHNNCGGFCIKAGHAHFARLLRTLPDRYAYHEQKEAEIRVRLGDVAILRDRADAESSPLTLRAFRERLEAGGAFDEFAIGGCGCFIDDLDDAAA